MSEQYFANLPSDQIGHELKSKVDKYYNFMINSGIFRRQYRSLLHYYGVSPSSNAQTDMIRSGGKSGQLALMKVNHYRNLAQNMVQLCTSQRPAPQPVATNTDAKSKQQVALAKGVIDYYNREKRVERFIRDATETAVLTGDGFIVTEWDGREQDLKIKMVASTDTIRDPNKTDYNELDWIITREWEDRFKVADIYAGAKRPEENTEVDDELQEKLSTLRGSILGQQTKSEYSRSRMTMMNWLYNSELMGQSDDISVYTLWHKKTPTVPDGLIVKFLEDGTVLFYGKMPYKTIPVRRVTPGNLAGSSFGYSPMFDLLVIQEAIDALYSAVATNQMTFGVQLIMAMKGSDIDFKQLSRGLSYIEYANPEGKPEPLNLTHTPAEVFSFIQQLEHVMETISGVNSVVRGDPKDNLKSGSALAMVQSQAILYMSGLQQSVVGLMQDVYTDMINILKANAKNEKIISIVGKFNRSQLIGFKSDDIDQIDRVVFDVVGALEQTLPGRMTIAENLITAGLIKKPEEYISVIRTGLLEPILEGEDAELILIKSENESVVEGKELIALITDDHSLHIREHRCVLATPEARQNPKLVQAMEQHIASHVQFLTDPSLEPLFAVLGYNTMSAAMSPDAGQGYAQAGPGAEKKPRQPNLPKNPATGNEWNPADGGLSPTGTKGGGGK